MSENLSELQLKKDAVEAERENLRDFYDRLEGLDWFYEMSDDGRVYREGAKAYLAVKYESTRNPAKAELFNVYEKYVFTGKPPKPERP